MSRAVYIYEPQLNDHFNELFGEEYQDTELKEVFEEAFTTYAPDDGVLEGDLVDSFEMMLDEAWEERGFKGNPPSPEAEVKAVAEAMASHVVEEMVRTKAPVDPIFERAPEVQAAYRPFYEAWSKAEGYVDDENWLWAQSSVYHDAEELAKELTESHFDEYEYTATGDATEMVKDHIADDPGEYMDLVEALDIDLDDDMYAMASAKKWGKKAFQIAGVTFKTAELDTQVRIYIADLAAYNDGKLIGEWVDLPADEDELEAIMDRLSHGGQQDIAIHDYEAPFKIDEYDGIVALNEAVQTLEDADIDFEVVTCVKDNLGYTDWDEAISYAEEAGAIDISDRYGSRPHNPEEQLAYYFVEEVDGGIQNLPEETVEMYFDYEQFGRDRSTELYEEVDEEYYDQFTSDREYGEAIVDDSGGVFNATSNPEYYFDYARYGRDLAYDYFLCGNYYIRSM